VASVASIDPGKLFVFTPSKVVRHNDGVAGTDESQPSHQLDRIAFFCPAHKADIEAGADCAGARL
jgi:hypothetical protein